MKKKTVQTDLGDSIAKSFMKLKQIVIKYRIWAQDLEHF